jgi:hypothetical protein
VPSGWGPPLMPDPDWIEHQHNEFDVFHVPFGFDAIGPEVLTDGVEALKMHHNSLVYTVHDVQTRTIPTCLPTLIERRARR